VRNRQIAVRSLWISWVSYEYRFDFPAVGAPGCQIGRTKAENKDWAIGASDSYGVHIEYKQGGPFCQF
jgi:hypothetical protein